MDEDPKDISKYNLTFDTHNVTEALAGLSGWFNKEEGYQNNWEYNQVMSNINTRYMNKTEENGLSIALRLIMHYAGDIHQPLHGSTRVNHEYPQGDRGGNDYPLAEQDGIKELHAVWDSMIFEHTGYANLPYSDADWE